MRLTLSLGRLVIAELRVFELDGDETYYGTSHADTEISEPIEPDTWTFGFGGVRN